MEKAVHLLNSGLNDEAAEQALAAIKLDPERFPAYQVAASALSAQGKTTGVRELLRKQTSLLADAANARNPDLPAELLVSVEDDVELCVQSPQVSLRCFEEVLVCC